MLLRMPWVTQDDRVREKTRELAVRRIVDLEKQIKAHPRNGTTLEKRLARRIALQRARLRWFESRDAHFDGKWRYYFDIALRLGRENRELRAQLADLQKSTE